ncbi:hypothetical protein VNO77_34395 [Canavalia gladiata]|uniref:Uncharacterized protein n=1 Tax=Canavalia gladiata TaxID=3824 RepID=A0AAN9PX71_CANGL
MHAKRTWGQTTDMFKDKTIRGQQAEVVQVVEDLGSQLIALSSNPVSHATYFLTKRMLTNITTLPLSISRISNQPLLGNYEITPWEFSQFPVMSQPQKRQSGPGEWGA